MAGIGMKSDRTRALDLHHQGYPVDAIASQLGTTTDRVREWVFPRRRPLERKATPRKRQAIKTTSSRQQEKCRPAACVVCRRPGPSHTAHLIDKGQAEDFGDPRATIPLCPDHHRAYDEEDFDLLPYLEPHHREELAYAVERFGLLSTLQRVTGSRWEPTP
jgi:hypothetical protein